MSILSFSEALRDSNGKAQADLLFGILLDVVERHNLELSALLRGQAALSGCTPGTLGRALQAQGIWFQLLSIAEQNAAMRRLREEERQAGGGALPGSFDAVIQEAVASGVTAEAMADRLASLRIHSVITAYPTEARRVTVLEKLREIYLPLLDLENSRSTPRERARITRRIRDQVELIWLTGDLRATSTRPRRRWRYAISGSRASTRRSWTARRHVSPNGLRAVATGSRCACR